MEDATNAGGRNAKDCTLILTEGDSAKTLAVAGLSEVGRDNYGIFPLRGKLLNVREGTHSQIMNNSEIQHIKQILGLKQGKEYTSTSELRYGHLMIMTDQDHGNTPHRSENIKSRYNKIIVRSNNNVSNLLVYQRVIKRCHSFSCLNMKIGRK